MLDRAFAFRSVSYWADLNWALAFLSRTILRTWQVVPVLLNELFGHPENAGSDRAMTAMLRMKKIDIAEIERAYAG